MKRDNWIEQRSEPFPGSIFPRIGHIERFYPGFARWFWDKCVPDLASGRRRIFWESDGNAYAILIAKRYSNERKICTIYVSPGLENRGVGKHLVTRAINWLDCRRPMLTVPEERVARLSPLLNGFDFSLDQITESYYRLGRKEYVFNGKLTDISCSLGGRQKRMRINAG